MGAGKLSDKQPLSPAPTVELEEPSTIAFAKEERMSSSRIFEEEEADARVQLIPLRGAVDGSKKGSKEK